MLEGLAALQQQLQTEKIENNRLRYLNDFLKKFSQQANRQPSEQPSTQMEEEKELKNVVENFSQTKNVPKVMEELKKIEKSVHSNMENTQNVIKSLQKIPSTLSLSLSGPSQKSSESNSGSSPKQSSSLTSSHGTLFKSAYDRALGDSDSKPFDPQSYEREESKHESETMVEDEKNSPHLQKKKPVQKSTNLADTKKSEIIKSNKNQMEIENRSEGKLKISSYKSFKEKAGITTKDKTIESYLKKITYNLDGQYNEDPQRNDEMRRALEMINNGQLPHLNENAAKLVEKIKSKYEEYKRTLSLGQPPPQPPKNDNKKDNKKDDKKSGKRPRKEK